ncbi:Putative WD40/YVTN repeat-like-containing domain superfamily [Septoria linicola]|uniref:WD40/YVTN repeat-like-containing domain superfamily n=1 Tax=Septoria linicola TaxID=215465 RepID=A0A9Q9ALH9_9PEZI|nr:putative WD40/YVTN repeat-like-containing domain superfamily [Septoria linicola]USW51185.1 Putative WD40/YVTN repeat-like-containing domain superfamily [Septoria linicola]
MRLESTERTQQRPSTNGSSQHGSSPNTNGSVKSETNGYHTNGHVESAVVRNNEPFFGHDREEVTRILLQTLSDLGYRDAAKQLSKESGYELEIPSVAAFRNAVLSGDWDEAESLLLGSDPEDGGVSLDIGHGASWRKDARLSIGSQNALSRKGLPLAEGANITLLKFFLRQQKYLELLEKRDLNAALNVLRSELTPLKTDTGRLHFLASLVMCPTTDDLHVQAEWSGVRGTSRSNLLSEISKSISPSVMIPEHRLATLLTSVQEEQVLDCRYHNTMVMPSLYTDHDCSADDFPLQTQLELRTHSDEVWFLEFSHDGSMLATAGKDGLVVVYDTIRWRPIHEFREHERSPHATASNSVGGASDNRGICYVAFSPDDQYLISCSQNNEFVVVSIRDGQRVCHADHFDYPVTTAAWLPDSQTFIVGTQGSRRPLGMYSLRSAGSSNSGSVLRNPEIHSWRDPPWDPSMKSDQPTSFRITDCAVDATGTRMAATTIDNRIMVYSLGSADRYCKLAEWQMEDRLTSINFSADGNLLLVNMNEGKVLAIDSETGEIARSYDGAHQREFVIRSAFGGAGESFVISGSEDSKVYIWRRQTGHLVTALEAHHPGTVNAVAWHPTNHGIFASAGDDRRVRIWTSANARRKPETIEGSRTQSSGLGQYY